jgi:glutamate 5-kinase
MAGGSASSTGSGGMATKIAAARIAVGAGCRMAIAAGHHRHPLRRLERVDARCTWFLPAATPPTSRKQWLAGALRPAGSVRIDAGAVRALRSGKSLLPAGVTATQGRYTSGDTISVCTAEGQELARGIAAYSDADTTRILGRRSADIEALLGYAGPAELIHRDDLVLLESRS